MSATDRAAGASFLALSCVGFIASALPIAAYAQSATAPAEEQAVELEGVTVTDSAIEDEIKVERVESPKATAPLLDTPQTITVIGNTVIRQQNLLTLRDALTTLPGITFGAGEGGGGFGDSINLRGYSANNDITQDGVRDSAQYSRSDTFDLEQLEVYNGANSVFNGSGSVGGTINLVSKTPKPEDLTIIGGGIGTDDYYRATIDSNLRINDLVAVRLNAMGHKNDLPGRDVERFKRWGVAPSVTIGVDAPTSLTLAYFHQEDENVPVYGLPYFAVAGGVLEEVDRSAYYGIPNLDRQDQSIDRLTMIFRHEVSDAVSVRNLTRWQHVIQDSITSSPQGIFCLTATRLQPTGAACPTGLTPGQYLPSGPRGNLREQDNQLLYNQTDLRIATPIGGIENVLNIGSSFTKEDYELRAGNVLRNPGGATPNPAQPAVSIANPDLFYRGPINRTLTGFSEGTTETVAVYAFDTLSLNEMVELNAGVRWESNRGEFRADTITPEALAIPAGQPTRYLRGRVQNSDERLFSYRFGAVFKPVPNASLYAAYGNAKTPSSATVRLGCGLPTGNLPQNSAADPCQAAPETAKNYEIGAKADLFEGGLQLTAALFRNERTNFRVASNDPTIPDPQVLDGRSRVDGAALGASGQITPNWAIFANYTYLDGEILQAVSNFCLANPGAANCGNSAAVPDPQAGNIIQQTPKHSGSLFTTYTLPFGLQLGYGLSYQGSFALNQSTLAAPTVFRSNDYLTHRALISYPITDGLTAQLNVQNFTDRKYETGIRNNGWATPGDRRSAVLTLFYSL